VKEQVNYGRKLVVRIDEGCKYFSKFRVAGNEVEKLHGPTYQLFGREAVPREGRHYFDLRIILIRNNNIVVGVISDKSKDEQFSFKKPNCVCYNGYDGSICEQEKQRLVDCKPREGQRIRTVVDLVDPSNATVSWYLMGGEQGTHAIGTAAIPPSMAKLPLFPYFELYWENNKVKINA
jgi:hypothetical protein